MSELANPVNPVYDFCVVGSGLFGSACAKYVAEDGSAVLVGPSEDAKVKTQVFGAWHDEGRITCPWFKTFAWRDLTRQSMKRYRDIETDSGIGFYTEAGYLTVRSRSDSTEKDLEYFEKLAETIRTEGFELKQLTDEHAQENFPFLRFPSDAVGYHHPEISGHLSPRQLVKAQQVLAKRRGCDVVDGVVRNVAGNVEKGFEVNVERSDGSGVQTVLAKKLILAPGAYVNLNSWIRNLIPDDKKGLEPDLTLKSQTVAYLELEASEAERLRTMPSMGTGYQWGPIDGTYILPPIKYPDGKYYLKLGHHDNFEETITNDADARVADVEKWYGSAEGNRDAVSALADFVTESLIPDLKVVSVHGGCCVTSDAKGKRAPFIDTLLDGVTLVAGGCGYGAKCSDEIGRIGARLAARGEWTSDIERKECQIIWRQF